MASKIERGLSWIKQLLGRKREPSVIVRRLEGTNIETFCFDGYDVEVHVYSDRVSASIYHQGLLLLKTYRFSNPLGEYVDSCSVSRWPNYKVRNYVRNYLAKRLQEITENKE